MDQAADVFKLNEDQALLSSLKAAGLSGQTEKVNELSVKFEEHSEQLQEVTLPLVVAIVVVVFVAAAVLWTTVMLVCGLNMMDVTR